MLSFENIKFSDFDNLGFWLKIYKIKEPFQLLNC